MKKPIKKISACHPEGHGYLEIARLSRGFDDLVVIGWLSAKKDDLFFIEADDGTTIPITETFRFFRQDIENTGLPITHEKISEKSGFISYIQPAKNINKLHLFGIHEDAIYIIHEILIEVVNESIENSINWVEKIVQTLPEEYVNRLKKFEIPYRDRRLEKINDLLKMPFNYQDIDTEVTTIIISKDHWRTKALITAIEANNSIKNKYMIFFNCVDESQQFKSLVPALKSAFGVFLETILVNSIYEAVLINKLIKQTKSKNILIINDAIIPNQKDFIKRILFYLHSTNSIAVIPRQLDIYGEEHCAYIEIRNDVIPPQIHTKMTFSGRSPSAVNKPYNLDCVIFDRAKLLQLGGIDLQIDIRSLCPRRISIKNISEFTSIFPTDVYVTSLRKSRTIISSSPTLEDLKNLVNLDLI